MSTKYGMLARAWVSMVVVAAVAAGVRLPGIYGRPFWEDEVASARILVQPTFPAMLRRVADTESTPPLWYAVAWLVHRLGMPLQSERLLSVVFGSLFAVAVVSLSRRFVPLPLAATAGLIAALGGQFVVHGAELRAYELLALLSVMLGLAMLNLLEQAPRRWDVVLAATVAAGCLTHYFFVFSVAAVLGWLWLDPGARPVRRRGTVAIVAGGALAAPAVPLMLVQYGHGRFNWIGSFRWRDVLAVPLRLFTLAYRNTTVGPVLSVSLLVVLSIGALFLARRSAGGRLVAVLAFVPIAAAAAAWAAGMPIFDLRNLIGIGAYVAVLTVAAIDTLSVRLGTVGAVAVVAALALSLASSNAQQIAPYDVMARSLVRSGWNDTKPIMVYGDPYRYRAPLEWYLPRRPLLEMSRALDGTCRDVFVVTGAGKVRQRRLPARTVLRGRTLLVDPGHRPRCVLLRHARRTLAAPS